MASQAVLDEIKKELCIETEEPLGKALWERRLKEGPGSTPRTKYLYKRCRWKNVMAGEYEREDIRIGTERMRLTTEAHKASVGEPEIIRRAKMVENYCKKASIFIQDGELIVGDHCEYPDVLELYPEYGYFPTMDFITMDIMPPELVKEATEIAEYWKPLACQAKCEGYYTPEELEALFTFAVVQPPEWVASYSSVVPPYLSIFDDGVEKRIKQAEENIGKAMAELRTSPWRGPERLPLLDKIDVWRAMIIVGKAVIGWARRYGRLAKFIAENFDLSDSVVGAEQRKKELLEIADICYRIPAEPAKGFKDAMQSKWFCFQIVTAIERYAGGYSQLEDRIMWPYYKASVIDKTFQPMSREEAIELVECERLKICERGVARGRFSRESFPGVNDLHILTIGGLDENGEDATNDLTNVILEAALNIFTNEPSIGFRYSPKINEKTRRLVYECIAQGMGFPSLKHDEKCIKQNIEHYHWPADEAAHWCLVLCMAPGVCKRRNTQKTRVEGGGVSACPAKSMELALSDGFDYSFTKKQIGPRTGDPTKFKSFDDVLNAFMEQTNFWTTIHFMNRDITRRAEYLWGEAPFVSLMDDTSLEKGIGAIANFEWANPWTDPVPGPQTCIDDLAAIKYWIFDKKKYTMEQLIKALRANWEGYEEMRRDFLAAPKWGNDDDYVDEIGARVYNMIADIYDMTRQVSSAEISPMAVPQTVSIYASRAPIVGAQPFGRRHGEVLHDGGCSPYMGLDKKGPTAVLKTMSKIPQERYKGIQLNQRLPVGLMRESEKGFDVWTAYMKTWHDFNLDHVQFNVVRSEDMRAAQKEPEKWAHLIVRIAGYSARFVSLPKYTQDSIIARTEQQIG